MVSSSPPTFSTASLANVSWTMLAAILERISIGLVLIRIYNIFLFGKLARVVMGSHLGLDFHMYIYVSTYVRL